VLVVQNLFTVLQEIPNAVGNSNKKKSLNGNN